MEPHSIQQIIAAIGADQHQGSSETVVRRVCTDSRKAQQGDLFFALKGERFDGHDFLGDVAQKGVAAVVVERAKTPASRFPCALLAVENTRQALGKLAASYRARFDLPVVAVCGSNGKTTTKELLASVLSQKFPTLASEASFNNDIGVPLTLLKLEPHHRAAVLEVGTNHPGELAPLLRMIQPKFGVLTSLGREHLEFFGDLAGVTEEEGWLAELLPSSGKLFINDDSEWTSRVTLRTKAAVVRVGSGPRHDWRLGNVSTNEEGVSFQVVSPRPAFDGEYQLNLLGRHQAMNGLLAAAVGTELGLSPEDVRRGLAACQPARMRLQLWKCKGVSVLDDCYNANLDSVIAALETLREFRGCQRRIAVLGDMAEVGNHSAASHSEIGHRAAQSGVTCLVAVGQWSHATAQAARAGGLRHVTEFLDVPAAARAVKKMVQPGDLVLLKASRAVGLERVGEMLRELSDE